MAQALAQKTQEVTVTEPGTYELSALYKRADVVALVEMVAGDTENYEKVVYKATYALFLPPTTISPPPTAISTTPTYGGRSSS